MYDQNLNVFDTICNFNALIGDKWRALWLPKEYTLTCSFSRPYLTVLDTGHVIINSIFLKRIVFKNSYFLNIDTIVEKIAGFNSFFALNYNCLASLDYPPFGKFMCYSDNSFAVYKKSGFANWFYDPTSVLNYDDNSFIKIYPNPINDIVTISLSNNELLKNAEVKIIDISGREVKKFVTKIEEQVMLDLADLEKGIYFIKIYNTDKLIAISKIIKE